MPWRQLLLSVWLYICIRGQCVVIFSVAILSFYKVAELPVLSVHTIKAGKNAAQSCVLGVESLVAWLCAVGAVTVIKVMQRIMLFPSYA